MAKQTGLAPLRNESAAPIDCAIVGLKKVGPKDKLGQTRYAVVTGTLANPVVDSTPEPLEFASEMLKRAIHHMLDNLK